MRLLTAGSVVVLLHTFSLQGQLAASTLHYMAPCHALRIPLLLMHTPCLYTDTLTPQYNPFCPRATYYPASIEVTLEKSVIGALKRNVGIATEQPPPSGLATAVPRQCEILTRKWLDIYAAQ